MAERISSLYPSRYAVVLDQLGRRLGEAKVSTTLRGYGELVRWAEGFGPVRCAGVEGTGSYGAGLAHHLKIAVVGIERPKRRHPRHNGKSDPKDADAAARAVLVMSATLELRHQEDAIEAGADGVIDKLDSPEGVFAAIRGDGGG